MHAGNSVDPGTRAIRTPLVMANSYALPEDPSQLSWSAHDVPLYTRNSGANQIALQRKLAALEHGADAVVLASGVAALHAVFFTLLRTGDHAVVSDVTYEARVAAVRRHAPRPLRHRGHVRRHQRPRRGRAPPCARTRSSCTPR